MAEELKQLVEIIEKAMLKSGYNGLTMAESIARAILMDGYHK